MPACLPSEVVVIFLEVGVLGGEAGMSFQLSGELAVWPWAGCTASLGSGSKHHRRFHERTVLPDGMRTMEQ